jgi:hypothetical protein
MNTYPCVFDLLKPEAVQGSVYSFQDQPVDAPRLIFDINGLDTDKVEPVPVKWTLHDGHGEAITA